MLTRQQILEANDKPLKEVNVPCWQGSVYVRCMSAKEKDAFESSLLGDKERDMANIRARLAVLTLCDENGSLIFSKEDAELLGTKSVLALDTLLPVIKRLNAIEDKEVEELKKN